MVRVVLTPLLFPIIAWPPAPELDRFGKLIPAKAGPGELRGEALFPGKARCASCHPAPFYTDNQMHDLCVEEFYDGRAEGWVKTFSLRGIKDSPPLFPRRPLADYRRYRRVV